MGVYLATQRAVDYRAKPLIYKVVIRSSVKSPSTGINLMIYDTAGEDFHRDRLTTYARFVFNANAFIFVVDPFTIKSITNELPQRLQAQWRPVFDLAQRSRADECLHNTIDHFMRSRGPRYDFSLPDIPIAVMLSKSDLLQHVNLPNSYGFMQMQPIYGDYLDLRDIEQVDQEVRAVLTHYSQKNLLYATASFRLVKFFATSATGTIPDDTGMFPSVVPRRCLDPLLWILYCFNMIEGRYR